MTGCLLSDWLHGSSLMTWEVTKWNTAYLHTLPVIVIAAVFQLACLLKCLRTTIDSEGDKLKLKLIVGCCLKTNASCITALLANSIQSLSNLLRIRISAKTKLPVCEHLWLTWRSFWWHPIFLGSRAKLNVYFRQAFKHYTTDRWLPLTRGDMRHLWTVWHAQCWIFRSK